MIRIGIVGFGNLGKAVLNVFKNCQKIKIVAIFSKHILASEICGVPVFNPSLALRFKNKIDLMVLCTGSQNSMLHDAPFFAEHFNIINSFDIHSKIKNELNKLNNICKQANTFSIIACGWDPGVFSLFRAYFSLFCQHFAVFYGKGVSLGHTNAVKHIKGVRDAISFTMPNNKALMLAKKGNNLQTNLLRREVFIAPATKNKAIKQKVLNMPHYFKGENTTVHFVSQEKLNALKTLAHKGEIIASNNFLSSETYALKFKTTSNPMATAKIMLAFSLKIKKLKLKYGAGAFTPLNFAPANLINQKNMFKGIV